jgi:uncharacterized protein YndB with AHSA1/START domain
MAKFHGGYFRKIRSRDWAVTERRRERGNMNNNGVAKASIGIRAPIGKVWDALVSPGAIRQHMFGTCAVSDWKEGCAIVWRGHWQGKPYEDEGRIIKVEKEHLLQYRHYNLSARRTCVSGNDHIVTMKISETESQTVIALSQDNNPSEEAREHAAQDLRSLLGRLKNLLEESPE